MFLSTNRKFKNNFHVKEKLFLSVNISKLIRDDKNIYLHKNDDKKLTKLFRRSWGTKENYVEQPLPDVEKI